MDVLEKAMIVIAAIIWVAVIVITAGVTYGWFAL